MSRYDAMFQRLARRREGAFGVFLMLGDPGLAESAALLDAAVEGDADMVEVGIPFSDPVADGPTIQGAAARALAAGVTVGDCFALIAGFRERHPRVPLGVLTYANLVVARGRSVFCRAAAEAGADSILVADVPLLEAEPFAAAARGAGLDPVLIAAANTPADRLRRIAALGGGYTYCLARAGVTGSGEAAQFDQSEMLATLRNAGAPPPVFGFGISRPAHVRAAIRAGAAGAISGSAVIEEARSDPSNAAARVRGFVGEMKKATRKEGVAPVVQAS